MKLASEHDEKEEVAIKCIIEKNPKTSCNCSTKNGGMKVATLIRSTSVNPQINEAMY